MKTDLIYMKHMQQYECSAKLIEIIEYNEKHALILDQTVFYPQGGGQPFDTGHINFSDGVIFNVTEVRLINNEIYHIGDFLNGREPNNIEVSCFVNVSRRILNTRLHSTGHLIDLALKKLAINWEPGKGFHFPEGPYVEYEGVLSPDENEGVRIRIENTCNEIITAGCETSMIFNQNALVNGKPQRIVYYDDFGIACGGTHVQNLKDIGEVQIRKISSKKGTIRISYQCQ